MMTWPVSGAKNHQPALPSPYAAGRSGGRPSRCKTARKDPPTPSISAWFAITVTAAIYAVPGTLAEKITAIGYYSQTIVRHILGN